MGVMHRLDRSLRPSSLQDEVNMISHQTVGSDIESIFTRVLVEHR